ncbi:hypothetical protein [Oxalicibacterium faecigallinarum]|uniref:HNH endonuclease n=1 Tax=Oxalicibacterium faecigallinarum TaxID=573741 RepID=A0A8J3AZW9_9BURK|nr:hypothetical protein [Oxalicibacterium faecigallinarum]GGI20498.1 hypothetical protein GCM10008066_24330 [Oxalicibacterium faecigallinarum]
MLKLKRLLGPNKQVREKMAALNPDFEAVKKEIRAAQVHYLKGPRGPNVLVPLGLDINLTKWIEERYKSAPKALSLNWIKDARKEHKLTACPMCGGSSVSTLDHVLPKREYPEFAVLSYNLVPSCDGCQRRRSSKGKSIEFVHPYFDHKMLDALRLTVRFSPPFEAVLFNVVPEGLIGGELIRMQTHLDECLPGDLFKREMNSHWRIWHMRCFRAGQHETFLRLQEDLKDEEFLTMNSWKVAFMRGLLKDKSALSWMEINPIV